jgi:hypothetical protein
MRQRLPGRNYTTLRRFAPVLAALLLCMAASQAPAATAVQTETIIVPGGSIPTDESAPDVPADEPTTPAPSVAVPDGPPPTVEYDVAKLPVPVARLRSQIIEAATTGDIEKLRPIIDSSEEPPSLSFDEIDDPIAFLKSSSGDEGGREILAVLIEVLEAGYVHVDVGTKDEMYVWPYFARYPVDKLDPKQLVELFKLVYAGDYEDMKTYGNYLYYRVGISPDGTWRYFIAGD